MAINLAVEMSSASKDTFISAKALSSSLTASQVYLLKRSEDYLKFNEGLEFIERDGQPVILLGKDEIHFYASGGVALVAQDGESGMMFDSWEQLSAYYLARYW